MCYCNDQENSKADLERQYDRLILQLREEIKELYSIFNFFLVANTALLGFAIQELPDYKKLFFLAGLSLSLLWYSIFDKQRACRDEWIEKIKEVEKITNIETRLRFFKNCAPGYGIAKSLLVVPLVFVAFWALYVSSIF